MSVAVRVLPGTKRVDSTTTLQLGWQDSELCEGSALMQSQGACFFLMIINIRTIKILNIAILPIIDTCNVNRQINI